VANGAPPLSVLLQRVEVLDKLRELELLLVPAPGAALAPLHRRLTYTQVANVPALVIGDLEQEPVAATGSPGFPETRPQTIRLWTCGQTQLLADRPDQLARRSVGPASARGSTTAEKGTPGTRASAGMKWRNTAAVGSTSARGLLRDTQARGGLLGVG